MKFQLASTMLMGLSLAASEIWIEAEQFAKKGGWVVDQQFMDFMGSPYLLAHGMGKPVEDAVAQLDIKKEGTYFDFVGSYKDQEFVTTGNYYLLANKIYKSTSDEGTFIKGTRAYLKAKDAAGEARIVNFTIADEIITGIKVIDANNDAKENIYNLNGQKVNNAKKGLYIKNGKKVMMK